MEGALYGHITVLIVTVVSQAADSKSIPNLNHHQTNV